MAQKIDIAELVAHGQLLAAEVRTWSDRQLRMCYAQEQTIAESANARTTRTASSRKTPDGRRDGRTRKPTTG